MRYNKEGCYTQLEGEETPIGFTNVKESTLNWFSTRALVVANISFFFVSLTFLLLSTKSYAQNSDQNTLLRSKIFYSSIIKSPIPFETTRFSSAPLSSKNASIYRQAPGPEVDAAWDRLADIGTHILSSDDIRSLGKDPSKTVRLPEDWGHGPDAHIATIDGIHLVHCLNSMRKSLYLNFDYYHSTLGPEYLPHLSHCVEAILMHLMCNPSMEFLTQNWIERQNLPFPDFAVNKKCWDYEAILKWKEEHRALDVERRFDNLMPPLGTVPEPLPPLVAETWEIIDSRHNSSSF